MLVYIEIASYVKRQACGGSVMVSRVFLRSKEFLKYVCWRCTRGCNCLSTHLPTECGRLAQSEHTGRVVIGVLWSFASR